MWNTWNNVLGGKFRGAAASADEGRGDRRITGITRLSHSLIAVGKGLPGVPSDGWPFYPIV